MTKIRKEQSFILTFQEKGQFLTTFPKRRFNETLHKYSTH